MSDRRTARIASALRHAAIWVVAPLAVATVVYVGLWNRYERAQAAAGRLPTPVAAELARLPAHVSALVVITFTAAAADAHPSRAVLAGHLHSAVVLADAPRLRVRAAALAARTAAISFAVSRGRAGCAAVRVGGRPAIRVAYAPTRAAACADAERGLRASGGG